MTEQHISFLRDMMNSKRADLAEAARQELKELTADLQSKGIIVV